MCGTSLTELWPPTGLQHSLGGIQAGTSFQPSRSYRQLIATAGSGQQYRQADSGEQHRWLLGLLGGAAVGSTWLAFDKSVSPAFADTNNSAASKATIRGQTAVSCFLLGPLLSLLQGVVPSPEQLLYRVKIIATERADLQPWELSGSLYGMATLNANNPSTLPHLQQIAAEAREKLPSMPLYDAITTAWALYTLDLADSSLWDTLITRVAAGDINEFDEPCQLYLLHAAMQQASLAQSARAAATAGPRPSREEIEPLIQRLPKRMRAKVLAAYQEYVPFYPYIEGAYMLELHVMKALPNLIAAAAAAGPSSSYGAALGHLTAADADAAVTVTSDSALLGRVKRDVFFHWREDQLLDKPQQDLNQVTYILSRRMGLTLQQQPDVEILLPTMRTAIFLGGEDVGGGLEMPDAVYLTSCQAAVTSLLRSNFSPTGGFARKQVPGLQAARQRCLTRRGWRCLELSQADVEAAMGDSKVTNHLKSVADQHTRLEALLKQKLGVR